jgi:tRNA ligase
MSGALPYESSCTLFFKIKFDEPYLLYSDWREVTNALLSMPAKIGHMNPNNYPKSKMRCDQTKVYVNWAIGEIKRNPKAFDQYNNKRIIKIREIFLEWLSSNQGMKPDHGADEFIKTIIVPVAIPGSGKQIGIVGQYRN